MNFILSDGRGFWTDLWGLALFAINGIGAVQYVIAASHGGWVTAQGRELHAVTGEPFVWAMVVFPIWGMFLMLNLAWGAALITRSKRLNKIWWLLTIPVWLIAMAIDFAHH